MPRVGFEPIISAEERPQTPALDRAATGIGLLYVQHRNIHDRNLYNDRVTCSDKRRRMVGL